MFDFIGVSILLLSLVAFAWLTRRAWRARRPFVRWTAVIASGALTIGSGVLLGAALVGYWTLNRTRDNPLPQMSVASTPEMVARGARFEPYCASCHAPEVGAPMTGRDFLEGDAPPVGRFHAPNLTPLHLAQWSDGEIVRAIREGVHRNGRSLLIMPSSVLRNVSDSDVQAIVAYLRSLPPEGSETPPNRLNVLGAVMINLAPIVEAQPPITGPVTAPPPGPTAEYGAYLSSLTCAICHGDDLLGEPVSATPTLAHIPQIWDEAQFLHFMRTGTRPGGASVDGDAMPWESLGRFLREDDDVLAVYRHLESLAKG